MSKYFYESPFFPEQVYCSETDLSPEILMEKVRDLPTEDPSVFEEMIVSGMVSKVQSFDVVTKQPTIYTDEPATEQELWGLYQNTLFQVNHWQRTLQDAQKKGYPYDGELDELEHETWKARQILITLRSRYRAKIAETQKKKHDRTSTYNAHLRSLNSQVIKTRELEADLDVVADLLVHLGRGERRVA